MKHVCQQTCFSVYSSNTLQQILYKLLSLLDKVTSIPGIYLNKKWHNSRIKTTTILVVCNGKKARAYLCILEITTNQTYDVDMSSSRSSSSSQDAKDANATAASSTILGFDMGSPELLLRLLRKYERLFRSKKMSNGNTACNRSCTKKSIIQVVRYQMSHTLSLPGNKHQKGCSYEVMAVI